MIMIILDFIEQNWAAFLEHCRQHGIDNESEVEEEIEKFKREGLK